MKSHKKRKQNYYQLSILRSPLSTELSLPLIISLGDRPSTDFLIKVMNFRGNELYFDIKKHLSVYEKS